MKAHIVPADSTERGIVLKGLAEEYPGAFIEFRPTVTDPNSKQNAANQGVSDMISNLGIIPDCQSFEDQFAALED